MTVARLHAAAARVAADPAVAQTTQKAGSPLEYLGAPAFQAYWIAEAQAMTQAVRRIGKVEQAAPRNRAGACLSHASRKRMRAKVAARPARRRYIGFVRGRTAADTRQCKAAEAPHSRRLQVNPYALPSLLCSVALVAGCGGGGGASSSPAPSTPSSAPSPSPSPAPAPAPGTAVYDAQSAWTRLLSTTGSWTVTGRGSDGLDYQLTLAIEPAGAAVFPVTGANALKSTLRNRIALGSGQVVQDVLNEQFTDAGYRLLGSRITTDGGTPSCSKTDVVAALPPSGSAPGTSGPLYAATTLSDCTASASALGTSYHTWSVVAAGGVVYLCVASSNRFLGETSDRLSETCIETDAAGNLGQRARITLVSPGFSVVAVN